MTPLAQHLSGGDLRSTGAADQAARALLQGTWSAEDFLSLLERSSEPVVRMRAADALEKATRSAPALLSCAAPRLLALLAAPQPKEVRWHLLQMAPRVRWAARQCPAVLLAVEDAFHDKSAIVHACALQALRELACQAPLFAAPYHARLLQALSSKYPSVQARARRLIGNKGVSPSA